MIVGDLDSSRTLVRPAEAETILIVDADTVLAFALALEDFEPIAWESPQVAKIGGLVERVELAARYGPEVLGAGVAGIFSVCPVEDVFSPPIGEGDDHLRMITHNVMRYLDDFPGERVVQNRFEFLLPRLVALCPDITEVEAASYA